MSFQHKVTNLMLGGGEMDGLEIGETGKEVKFDF